eukprot:4454685-Amphidinium_carterae.1
MSNNMKMGSKPEWCFRIHHSSHRNLWLFRCRFPRQTDARLSVRSLTQEGTNQPPKVKDFVGKVGP